MCSLTGLGGVVSLPQQSASVGYVEVMYYQENIETLTKAYIASNFFKFQ